MPVEMRVPTGRLLSLDFIIRSDPRRVIAVMMEFFLFFFPTLRPPICIVSIVVSGLTLSFDQIHDESSRP